MRISGRYGGLARRETRALLRLPCGSPAELLVVDALDRVSYAGTLLGTGDDRVTRLLARRAVTAAVEALRAVERSGANADVSSCRSALELSHAGLG